MTKAIVFDFDGVIHNTFDLHLKCFNTLMCEGEFTAREYRDLHDGNIHENVSLRHKLDLIDFSKYHETICDEFVAQEIAADIKSMLEKLADTYTLFIISSGGEKHQIPFLKQNDIGHLFARVLGKETHSSKVEKFRMLFHEHEYNPDELLFITDTLGDILEGNKVGVKTIAIDFGFHDRERLERGKPYAIISSWNELGNYV